MPQGKTMNEIALEAGVSAATVSRVLSGKTNVRPETAARIQALIEKYHFRPNAMARGLYNKQSNTLAFALPDLINPYYGRLFTAAEREARALGRSLELIHHPPAESLNADMAGRMIERRLDGVILNGEFIDPTPDSKDMRLLSELSEYMSIVLIGNMMPISGYRSIALNLASGAKQAVEYFLSLGHRRIALLGGRSGENHPYSRLRGFLDALMAFNLPTDHAHFPEDDSAKGGLNAMLAALDTIDPPTAVLCANDLVALGAVRAAQSHGLSIPRDLSIIGCDNSYLCDYLPVPLTSLDIRTDELATLAVRMALNEDAPDRVLCGSLVKRRSCAKHE